MLSLGPQSHHIIVDFFFFFAYLVFSTINMHYIYIHTNMYNARHNKMFLKENSHIEHIRPLVPFLSLHSGALLSRLKL